MDSVIQDIRFSGRQLLKTRGFTAIAVITLALCVGLNACIFIVVRTILLNPLHFPNSDRVVTMYNLYPRAGFDDRGQNSVPNYYDRRALTDVFSAVALYRGSHANLEMEGNPRHVETLQASPSFFEIVGLKPHRGRLFTGEEGEIGAEKKVLLGHGLWRELYAEDNEILGRSMQIDGQPYIIVGVLPPGFGETFDETVQLAMPTAFTAEQRSDLNRHSNNYSMIASLRPGVSLTQAQQAIDALNQANLEKFPMFREVIVNAGFRTRLLPWKTELTRHLAPSLWMLQGGVALVLLIGCVNIANLLLSRWLSRQNELAVRLALGANRLRLSRQLLTESLLLGLAGGFFGLLAAAWGLVLFQRWGLAGVPRAAEVSMDFSSIVLLSGLVLVAALGFGLLPLGHLWRVNLIASLHNDSRSATASSRANRLRNILVVAQIAMAYLLLTGAGLLLYSFWRVTQVEPGFSAEGVMTAALTLPKERYPEIPLRVQTAGLIVESLRALPGVTAVGLTDLLPFTNAENASVVTVEGLILKPGETPPVPRNVVADDGFFKALQIPLREGRGFGPEDTADSTPVVLVDETFAKRYFPGASALGARLRQGINEYDEARQKPARRHTIVGVVRAIASQDPSRPDLNGTIYFCHRQIEDGGRNLSLVLRTSGPPESLTGPIREEIQKIDSLLPIYETTSLQGLVSEALSDRRTPMLLTALFASAAMLLAALGIYGLLAYHLELRVREMGIRMALGARPRELLLMILGAGLRPAALGLAGGLGGAFLGTRWIRGLLFEVSPLDPKILLIMAVFLLAVALGACFLPAFRASRLSPLDALRGE